MGHFLPPGTTHEEEVWGRGGWTSEAGSSLGVTGAITGVPHFRSLWGRFLPDTEEGAISLLWCLASARTKTGSEGD